MKKKILPLTLVFVMCFAGVLALQIFWGRLNNEALSSSTDKNAELYEGNYQNDRYITPENGLIRLKNIEAPVVVVMFWSSWCLPCMAEFKQLKTFVETYSSDQVFFLGVDEDEKDSLMAIKKIKENFELNISFVEDLNGEVAKRYQVSTLPTSFIFVRGRFVERIDGPIPFGELPWKKWVQ